MGKGGNNTCQRGQLSMDASAAMAVAPAQAAPSRLAQMVDTLPAMSEQARMRAELHELDKALGFEPGHYLYAGSANLQVRGIRWMGDDVDMFVSPRQWKQLLRDPEWAILYPDPQHPPLAERYINGRKVHCFYEWARPEEIDIAAALARPQEVDGLPFFEFETWVQTKLGVLRDKDVADLALLSEYSRRRRQQWIRHMAA